MRPSLSRGKGITFCILLIAALIPSFAQDKSTISDMGAVTGTVYDSKTGKVIREATVAVKELKSQTDIDGKYVLKLPSGVCTLVVSGNGYFELRVESVKVKSGTINYIDPILVPTNTVKEEQVVVTADTPKSATIKSVMLERQQAQTIIDNISAEDISKNPDSDAAAVLERVTGVSVLEDKYIYVRGLGERYSSTQVNGSMVPSTNPEKKVIAFDLFPASLINKISTLKSYTPDQPGDFSGGLVKVDTIEFPERLILKYSTAIGFNSNVSTKTALSYSGSNLDWIGFGYSDRKLPSIFPNEKIAKRNELVGTGFSPKQLQAFGRDFRNEWQLADSKAAPDISQSLTAGGTIGSLGMAFSLTYNHKNSRVLQTVNSYVMSGGQLTPWNLLTNDKNTETIKSGIVGNLSYKLGTNHKLLWKNFYTRDSSDETRLLYGYSSGNTADERDTRLRYLQETLLTTQAGGEHYFPFFGNTLLEWRMAYSTSSRTEPDLRETIYRSEAGRNQYYFSPEGQSGFRQFGNQNDKIYEPGFDWDFYLNHGGVFASIRVGGLYQRRVRNFSSRRFVFLIEDRSIDLRQSPEQLFRPENIAPNKIELREITRFTDAFDAGQNIYSGYSMADILFFSKWRFIGGVRYERSRIYLDTYDPYAPDLTPLVTRLDNNDLLPAASVIYSPHKSINFRVGYSHTLNRPEFREMAPFQFTDISGRSTILGNPQLKQSRIHNYDFRWEWFPNDQNLYAVSYFEKRFNKPIEKILYYAADLLTSFANIDSARSRGIEIEIKRGLGFLSQRLENFNLYGNFSRIYSGVTIGDIPGVVMTSKERPLQGQSKYILNANLEYANPRTHTDFRMLYNLVGDRITEVGATLLPDVYEKPNHFLDFSLGQRLPGWRGVKIKFTAQNILNRAIQELQGGRLYNGYRTGRSFGIGMSYDLR
jgi:outer membrane receptor protein involved in Fe transport